MRLKQKMDQSLGQKIDKRCKPQFGPDKKCKEGGGTLKCYLWIKMLTNAFLLVWIMFNLREDHSC
jgi:hypothetical protein